MSTTIDNLTRIVQYRGAKTDCEAGDGTIEEGALAFATDTGEIGIYTNGAWVWIGTGSVTSVSDTATIDLSLAAGVLSAALKDTAVTPNSYTNPNITVDAQGRITAASSGTSGGKYRQFVYTMVAGDISFVIADGQPVMALQNLE